MKLNSDELHAGTMEAQAAAAIAGHINGVDSEKRKRTRGAKPKYHFVTAEEAIAHRYYPIVCTSSINQGSLFCFTWLF